MNIFRQHSTYKENYYRGTAGNAGFVHHRCTKIHLYTIYL